LISPSLAEFEKSIPLDNRFDITLSNARAYFVRAIMSGLIIHYSLFFQLDIVIEINSLSYSQDLKMCAQ
jgi:hypothetical protein